MNLANPETTLAFTADEIAFPRADGRQDDLGLVAKAVVQRARGRLEAWNDAGASGAGIVDAFTGVMDRTVRFLCGDAELAMEFDRVVETDIVRRNPDRFLKDAVAQNAERHRHYGSSVYLLEPHVKEGEGGLRDLHSALWMARVKFKVRSLRE